MGKQQPSNIKFRRAGGPVDLRHRHLRINYVALADHHLGNAADA
jgi:hypothetical protein